MRKSRHLFLTGSIAAACTTVAITVGLATGGVAVGATAPTPTASPATTASEKTADATVTPAPAPAKPIVRSSLIAADGASDGPVNGGTVVTVTGADLEVVATANFGGNPGHVTLATEDTVTIETPPATDLNEGTVAVELFDAEGAAVDVVAGEAAATAAATSDAAPAAIPASPLTFSYVPDPRVTAQSEYIQKYWQDYNSEAYGRLPGTDCVNFASQSLVARGWAMDDKWSYKPDAAGYSSAWASSTAFDAYLEAHPERATPLSDDERAKVKVGDIVQFDWDSSGDKDHTGIITRVEKTEDGAKLFYASHTQNNEYKSVDESLTNAGGTASYWSVS